MPQAGEQPVQRSRGETQLEEVWEQLQRGQEDMIQRERHVPEP